MNSKVDPAKVDGDVKQKVKFYGQQASDTMLRPEQVSQELEQANGDGEDILSGSEDPARVSDDPGSDGSKEDDDNKDADLKEKAKFYKHQASDAMLRPEQVSTDQVSIELK